MARFKMRRIAGKELGARDPNHPMQPGPRITRLWRRSFGANVCVRLPCQLAVFSILATIAGCAETPSAKAPLPAPANVVMPNVSTTANATQPMGISDALSSGQGSARPKLSAQAAQLYMAGMQAFQAGTLDVAEDLFEKAVESDSKAYQAYYSLGVVRERKNDNSGALSAYAKAIGIVPDYEPAIVAYGVLTALNGNVDEAEQYLNGRLAKMEKSAAVTTAMAEVNRCAGSQAQRRSSRNKL